MRITSQVFFTRPLSGYRPLHVRRGGHERWVRYGLRLDVAICSDGHLASAILTQPQALDLLPRRRPKRTRISAPVSFC